MSSDTLHIRQGDINKFEDRKRVNFINSLSGMKSCNLIGTKSKKGQTNLAIMSSAFHLGANPALLGIIIRPDSVARHTLEYIRETGSCSLNHVNSDIYEKAHQTSARYEQNVSEFEACELEEQYIEDITVPFVKESHIKVYLELVREVPIVENGTIMLILKIKDVFIPDNIMEDDGHLNIEEADSICVSGLSSYHKTKKLSRQKYAKVK